jgi:hypothetical protein
MPPKRNQRPNTRRFEAGDSYVRKMAMLKHTNPTKMKRWLISHCLKDKTLTIYSSLS